MIMTDPHARWRRRESPWWPVSAARKRKLAKRGVLCKWSSAWNTYIRPNPMPHFKESPGSCHPSAKNESE